MGMNGNRSRSVLSDSDLLEYLADGWTSGAIAKEHGFVQQTIMLRVQAIRRRYGAHTNEQLMILAIRSGELNIGLGPSFFGLGSAVLRRVV